MQQYFSILVDTNIFSTIQGTPLKHEPPMEVNRFSTKPYGSRIMLVQKENEVCVSRSLRTHDRRPRAHPNK